MRISDWRSDVCSSDLKLGLVAATEDDKIEALFAQELRIPEADEQTCLTFYRNQPQRFTNGEMVEARHILFQVTPNAPLELLREKIGRASCRERVCQYV